VAARPVATEVRAVARIVYAFSDDTPAFRLFWWDAQLTRKGVASR